MNRKSLIILFLASLILSIIIAICIMIVATKIESTEEILQEIFRGLIQFLLVIVIGSIASFALSEYRRRRTILENENEFRLKTLEKLINIYSQTKKSRMLLRAERNSLSEYNEHIEKLIDVQQNLREIRKEIDIRTGVFKKPEELIEKLQSMEDYLDTIIFEYEDNFIRMKDAGNEQAAKMIENLARINDFTGPYNDSQFKGEFVFAYLKVFDTINFI